MQQKWPKAKTMAKIPIGSANKHLAILSKKPMAIVKPNIKHERVSMKNWLRKKLQNFILRGDDAKTSEVHLARESTEADIEGLRFTVMPALGGTIIQLRTYDAKRDQQYCSTYVIPDGEDISQEVGRIVSVELLKS